MGQKIDWQVAGTVGSRIASQFNTVDGYQASQIANDFERLSDQAADVVIAETGLNPGSPQKVRSVDRSGWVEANTRSFERLLRPLTNRLETNSESRPAKKFSESSLGKKIGSRAEMADPVVSKVKGVAAVVGPKVVGTEIGALLGLASGRVLGQYDPLVDPDDDPSSQDVVYYVAPNILNIEHKYGFPPAEFRLWVAIHECTHRAQFMGVPWLREYYIGQVHELLASLDTDLTKIVDAVKRIADEPPEDDSKLTLSVVMKMATPEQRDTIKRLSALMALLEGHGDVVMDAPQERLIPSQARFSRVLATRRKGGTFSKILHKVTGMDAKLAQYAAGENFIEAVMASGGKSLFDQVWTSPEALPTLEEIYAPTDWVKRVKK